ncbi:EpsG family protein [Providencia sneebia]|uniref:Wzy n=1 Tax=Providencia sneebia DSM 19967 TaxID=1141660 RepID=K8WYH1_9GAMM|nr:hypothetical protein OO7_01156 [Providencia sneebia DSM 19967]
MPFIIFYIFISILLLLFQLVKQNTNIKNKNYLNSLFFYFISFLIVFLTCTRYKTGTDWEGYQNYFYNNDYSWEYLWSSFNEIIFNFGLPVEYIFVLTALLSLFLKLKTISILSKKSVFVIILCIPFIINKDFGTIRQGLAISICFYSSLYILDKKPIFFTILVLIAAQFHFSSLIFLFAYPLYNINLSKKFSFILILLCIVIGYSGLVIISINYITNILSSDSRIGYKLVKYLSYDDEYSSIYSNSILDPAAIKKIVSVLIFFYLTGYKKLLSLSKDYKLLFNLFIFGTCLFFIFNDIPQLRRLNGYFDLFQICLFVSLLSLIKDKANQLILISYLWLSSFINLYGYINSYPEYLDHYNSLLEFLF